MNGCSIPIGTRVRIVAGEYKDMLGDVVYEPSESFVRVRIDGLKKGHPERRCRRASVEVVSFFACSTLDSNSADSGIAGAVS